MNIKTSSKSIILLMPTCLYLKTEKTTKSAKFVFPPDILDQNEIKDEKKATKMLVEFLAKKDHLKKETLVLLSSKIPVESKVPQFIQKTLEKLDNRIINTTLTKTEEIAEISFEEYKAFFIKSKLPFSVSIKVMSIISLLVFLITSAFLLYPYINTPQDLSKKFSPVLDHQEGLSGPEIKEVSSPSASEATDEPILANKNNSSIQVLNGSGRSGEAKRIKDLLSNKDYKSISIGNYDGKTVEVTIISSKAGVPESVISEIKDILFKEFKNPVKTLKLDKDNKADIQIITGI
jgi:hypothetical protein